MVIKCPRCSSRYKIDAAGLPEEGTYARCRKCENVFFVRKRSIEEVSLLRKSIKNGGASSLAAHEEPSIPEPVIADAADTLGGEDEFSSHPDIMPAPEVSAQGIRLEERIETAESKTGENEIEALLAAYAPELPENEEAIDSISASTADTPLVESGSALIEQEPQAAKPENIEEPSLSLLPDDIEALLAAHSPMKKTKADESLSMPLQDETGSLLSQNAPVAATKQESSSISQDDIEALLAANSPAPPAQAPTATKQESSSISQDDIEALLAANAPAPPAQAPAVAKQESSSISQDDIEALLAANSPAPPAQAPVAAKQESSSISRDDIEALLAANSPAPPTQAPTAAKQESSSISQDDIEALLAANAPAPPAQAPTAAKQESSSISQDDIEALLAANVPGKSETSATAAAGSVQDDIDSLLAVHSPLAQSAKQAVSGGQNEIDLLLASAMSKPIPKAAATQSAAVPTAGEEILSQSDLDTLLSQPSQAMETATPSESKEGEGVISPLDIDSILDSAGFEEPGQAHMEAEEKAKDDGLLSQDTLDSLLTEVSQKDMDMPDEAMASEMGGGEDDELQKLLSGEEDTLGEALFQETSKVASSTGEPSLDEMLAGELTPREPAQAGGQDDDDFAGAMPGVFARGEASFPSMDEETGEEEAPAKKKGFSPAALFAPAIAALKKAMGKIPLPKFKFIGAMYHKLPPRLAGIAAGLALAIVVGAAVGGWLFLKGEQPIGTTQVAENQPGQKIASKPEAHQPAQPATQPADKQGAHSPEPAPVPAKAPAEGQPASKPSAPEPAVASAKASQGKYPVSFVVYLPVEFDTEATKVLNMNVELIFESETVAKLVRERLFFSAVTVEKAIDGFFREKFYEETVFAQDKLEEFLVQNLKAVKQFAGLKDVRLSGFSID
jgi:predicted Zn finger-like uncharacterized protein